jgi:hypothetical protein
MEGGNGRCAARVDGDTAGIDVVARRGPGDGAHDVVGAQAHDRAPYEERAEREQVSRAEQRCLDFLGAGRARARRKGDHDVAGADEAVDIGRDRCGARVARRIDEQRQWPTRLRKA